MIGFYKKILRGIRFTFQTIRQMVVRNKFKDVPEEVEKRYDVVI